MCFALLGGPERERHAIHSVLVPPAITHVVVAAHHPTTCAEHVFLDPVSTHGMALLLEVHGVAVIVLHPTAHVERILVVVLERLVGRESQPVVILRPLPVTRHFGTIQATLVKGAVCLHSFRHRMVEFDRHR